eukprot:3956285-Lingulodinium_polyedra.AAC.1
MAVAVLMVACGQPAGALAVVLCFCGLLRIGEALGLYREDLVVSDLGIVVLLRTTKTGPSQRVAIRNPSVVAFVRAALKAIRPRPGGFACPISYSQFR